MSHDYDVFFICYDETNREENWQRVLEFHPDAKKVEGVKGIAEAHMKCSKLSKTPRFWTIDGDNWLLEKLSVTGDWEHDVYFYRAIDCIDQEISTVGAVKLWKRGGIKNPNMNKGDFCTKATDTKLFRPEVFSIHKYDPTPYEAWRHTFRHAVKCLSGIIPPEALEVYRVSIEKHKEINPYSYRGYLDAIDYVKECQGDFSKINLINDFDWLKLKCPEEMKSGLS